MHKTLVVAKDSVFLVSYSLVIGLGKRVRVKPWVYSLYQYRKRVKFLRERYKREKRNSLAVF